MYTSIRLYRPSPRSARRRVRGKWGCARTELLSDRPNPITNHLNLFCFLWHFLSFSHCPLSLVHCFSRHLCEHVEQLPALVSSCVLDEWVGWSCPGNRPIERSLASQCGIQRSTSDHFSPPPTHFKDLGKQTKACNVRSCLPPNLVWGPFSAPIPDERHLRATCLPL